MIINKLGLPVSHAIIVPHVESQPIPTLSIPLTRKSTPLLNFLFMGVRVGYDFYIDGRL